jgi:hypothetical protein
MAIGMLIAMPIGFCFTHVCGSEDLRLMNTHWVKVANECDAYGHATGNIVAILVTNNTSKVIDDEVIDGFLKGVEYDA